MKTELINTPVAHKSNQNPFTHSKMFSHSSKKPHTCQTPEKNLPNLPKKKNSHSHYKKTQITKRTSDFQKEIHSLQKNTLLHSHLKDLSNTQKLPPKISTKRPPTHTSEVSPLTFTHKNPSLTRTSFVI